MSMFDEALAWHLGGYVPLPVRPNGSKAPAVNWSDYQHHRPAVDEIQQMFSIDHDGLGLLCGDISGQLELFEFEGRAVNEGLPAQLAQTMADHGASDLWEAITAGYIEVTPSGGLHYLYRVDGPAARNTKLARRPATGDELADHPGNRVQVLIETRGEGGFTVIAPSAGRTHPSGKPWTLIRGGMDTIPTISVDQRDLLYVAATLLDAMPAPQAPRHEIRHDITTNATPGARPGDDYNARANWDDLLLPHGWRKVRQFGGNRLGWVRPGKDIHGGISATTGGAADGGDRLYVFSTSTEFESEQPYTKFGAYALLEHGGDYVAAAKQLAADGWGSATEAADPVPALTLLQGDVTKPLLRILPTPAALDRPATDGSNALAVAPIDITLATYGPTEDGLARALIDLCANQLHYCPQRGMWLTWNGAGWEWDERELHREHAKRLARQLPDNEAWRRFRSRALSASGIAGIINLARTDPAVTIHLDDLDAHPWQLNTPGGIIDMRTGHLTPADRSALHSRTTTVTPDYHSPAPVWERFLGDTFGGDTAMISFVQRLIGLSAVGQVVEQQLPFAFGPGANGKSTLMNVIMKILGRGRDGYSIALDSEALMVRRHSEHPAELAQLAGARMVVSSEIEDGQRFAEARMKQLTGGDAISARFMRGNPFTFTPTHTLWLVGNHKPGTTAGGPAFWRRIKLIPFAHTVPEERRDPHLEDKLATEAPQILAWIARGAAAYAAYGLGTPDAVVAATEAYRDDQDSVAKFVAEACMLTSEGRVKVADLRAAYERFCRDSGDAPVSPKRFGEQLRDQHGIELERSRSSRMYAGITLYADPDEMDLDDWRDR